GPGVELGRIPADPVRGRVLGEEAQGDGGLVGGGGGGGAGAGVDGDQGRAGTHRVHHDGAGGAGRADVAGGVPQLDRDRAGHVVARGQHPVDGHLVVSVGIQERLPGPPRAAGAVAHLELGHRRGQIGAPHREVDGGGGGGGDA